MSRRDLVCVWSAISLVVALLFARFDGVKLLGQIGNSLEEILDLQTYKWFVEDCAGQEDVSIDTSSSLHGDVHVVYAAGAEQFQGLFSSMLSLSQHLELPGQCVIHIIVPRIDLEEAERLVQCFQVELDDLSSVPEVKIHEVKPSPFNLTLFKEVWENVWPAGAPFLTPLSFVQVHLLDYLPEVPRAIYLNTNTIVKADVRRLYRTPMKNALAATMDQKSVTWLTEYSKETDELDPTMLDNITNLDARTLSNGVLVIDLARWKKEKLTEKLHWQVMRAGGIKTARLAINLEFHDNVDVLDWRWNVMGLIMVPPRRCIDEAHILHWEGNAKPWTSNVTSARVRKFYDEVIGPFIPAVQCKWNRPMLDEDWTPTF